MPLSDPAYADIAHAVARRVSMYRIVTLYVVAMAADPTAAAFVVWALLSRDVPAPVAALSRALPVADTSVPYTPVAAESWMKQLVRVS